MLRSEPAEALSSSRAAFGPTARRGQDPLARRVASLLSVDVAMLPSPSDFESFSCVCDSKG